MTDVHYSSVSSDGALTFEPLEQPASSWQPVLLLEISRSRQLVLLMLGMDIGSVDYHLEFYTGGGTQVEHYRMRAPFLAPRKGERVHLHKGSLTLDVTRVTHDFVEHEGARLQHVVKVFGDEVPSVE